MGNFLKKYSGVNEIKADIFWGFSYLSDMNCESVYSQLENLGIIQLLLDQLSSEDTTQIIPALRTVGNFLTGNDQTTQYLINLNVIPTL